LEDKVSRDIGFNFQSDRKGDINGLKLDDSLCNEIWLSDGYL